MPDGSRAPVTRDLSRAQKQFFVLEQKGVEEEPDAWVIRGVATTPRADRVGDVVEPKGAVFDRMPKLMLYHDSRLPIGNLTTAKSTSSGIPFTARIPKVKEDGAVKNRIDEAVHSVKYDLISYVSIGFRPLEYEPLDTKDPYGPQRFTKWDWMELSLVTIPANPDAVITGIKSLDDQLRASRRSSLDRSAAPGIGGHANSQPGASGNSKPSKGKAMKGIPERLAELQGQISEKSNRIEELTTKCGGDPDQLNAEEQNELDALGLQVKEMNVTVDRLHTMNGSAKSARPVVSVSDPASGTRVRQGDFQMKSNLPKGTLWTRATLAQARCRGSKADAVNYARAAWRDTPEVAQYIEKANAGSGASGNWAEYLNTPNFIENEFLEALFPATILGRLAGLRPAPFDTKMLRQTGSSTVAWVGNAAAKPVGELAFDYVTVPKSKCAGIVVLTDDQVKSSHINSVEAVRRDLIKQITKFADQQFTDPSVAAVSGTSPASVTNGVNDIPASGATADDFRADIHTMMNRFAAAEIGIDEVTLITSPYVANGVSMMFNSLGQQEFPGVKVNGGMLPNGMPVIVSNAVPGTSSGSVVIGIAPGEVLFANDGGIVVDSSNEATLDMAGGNTPAFSLWQKNCVALRAEWFVSWIKGRSAAVQYISGAAYAPS